MNEVGGDEEEEWWRRKMSGGEGKSREKKLEVSEKHRRRGETGEVGDGQKESKKVRQTNSQLQSRENRSLD